ncbi:MAG TPA: ribose 5-phosphate isomerase B [Syntrophales bacterium]|jgi:RpiB/LacA/LacB family sugar-phosphate isomerase|nr:ribose 5-phosphate isomerase B [Syntrophales bacterium]
MKIVIGSDHAGLSLKEELKGFLDSLGYRAHDMGTHSDQASDYPDYAAKVAEAVSMGQFQRGVLVCGSGIGMAIVANKFPNVRAVVCLDEETARISRCHNDTNIIALAERRTNTETAQRILKTWLETEFEGGRHKARLDKIRDVERRLSGKD